MTCARCIVGLAAAAAMACGPTIQIESSTEASPTGSSTSQAESTSARPTIVPADSTSTGASTGGSTTAVADGTTEDPFACGCPDDQPIDFDQPTKEGISAADVLADFALTDIPWEWTGFEGPTTTTTLHLELVYEGGRVIDGPGGDDGCNFLSLLCTPELVIPVRANLVTEDGILAGSMPGTFSYSLDRGPLGTLWGIDVPIEELGGTLAEQVVPGVGGAPLALATVSYEQAWNAGGPWYGAMAGSDGTRMAVLGGNP